MRGVSEGIILCNGHGLSSVCTACTTCCTGLSVLFSDLYTVQLLMKKRAGTTTADQIRGSVGKVTSPDMTPIYICTVDSTFCIYEIYIMLMKRRMFPSVPKPTCAHGTQQERARKRGCYYLERVM